MFQIFLINSYFRLNNFKYEKKTFDIFSERLEAVTSNSPSSFEVDSTKRPTWPGCFSNWTSWTFEKSFSDAIPCKVISSSKLFKQFCVLGINS